LGGEEMAIAKGSRVRTGCGALGAAISVALGISGTAADDFGSEQIGATDAPPELRDWNGNAFQVSDDTLQPGATAIAVHFELPNTVGNPTTYCTFTAEKGTIRGSLSVRIFGYRRSTLEQRVLDKR
jgi:hypothetical protein